MASLNISKFPYDRRPSVDGDFTSSATAAEDTTSTGGCCYQIKKLCGYIGLALLILAVVVAVSGFLYYLITHRPMRPGVQITSMTVTPIDISADNTKITANWTIHLSVTNRRNKNPINYREFEVMVFYYGELLSRATLAPFHQDRNNQTAGLIAEPKAKFQNLTDGLVGRTIREDLDVDGIVSFDVAVRLGYNYDSELGNPNKPLHHKNFVCGDLHVRYPLSSDETHWSSGKMAGTSKRCEYFKSHF